MTPEQLKLIQKLAELGDVTYVKRGVSSLINAISEMNSKALELILEDNVSYQDTTKTIFLQKLKTLFQDFQKEDNKLIAYQGKCNYKECSNTNKNGFCFMGNKSGRYINFIVEENENGSIKDICTCHDFCPNEKVIDKNKEKMSYFIFFDERVDFVISPAYIYSNNKSISAIKELKQFNDAEIYKEDIIIWVKNYEDLYNTMDFADMFYKNLAPFYECYGHILKIYEFLQIEEEVSIALQEFASVNLDDEITVLRWLVKFEHFHYKLILLHPNIVSEESMKSGKIILYKDFTIYFKTEMLKNCIDVAEIFDKHYYQKLNKYNTLSQEEQENQMPFDDDYDYEKTTSLKYHLKVRGII